MESREQSSNLTAIQDIRTFVRGLDLWKSGCPYAQKRPLFLSKRNRHRRERELELIAIAERYHLPAWDGHKDYMARLLDAFDAACPYDDLVRSAHISQVSIPTTISEAIDAGNLLSRLQARVARGVTSELIAQLRSNDDALTMAAADRLAYFRVEVALASLIPGAQCNIGTTLSLLGPRKVWGQVYKDRLPQVQAAEAASDALPRLEHLHAAITKVLPESKALAIMQTQQKWLQARRAWENEMQWAGHVAHKWEPPKGKPKGHGNNDTVTDWGKRMLELQLELAELTSEAACHLTPLVEIACLYLNALGKRTITPDTFLEPVPFKLNEASPAEQKKRNRQREAQQTKQKRASSSYAYAPSPQAPEYEDDSYLYGPPHEWEILPRLDGTGHRNLAYFNAPDIQQPWERSSNPTS